MPATGSTLRITERRSFKRLQAECVDRSDSRYPEIASLAEDQSASARHLQSVAVMCMLDNDFSRTAEEVDAAHVPNGVPQRQA